MSQATVYNELQAKKFNLTRERLGLADWGEAAVKILQSKIAATPVDGWLGPQTIALWKAWAKVSDPKPVHVPTASAVGLPAGHLILSGAAHAVPAGVKFIHFFEKNGIPAQMDDTEPRKHPVFQFVIHRGAENTMKGENFAQATERILDGRGLSTTFSMDIDGTIYQHFDPAVRRGRHATHHNVQSDSIDIGGPFSQDFKAQPGQTATSFPAAIGRGEDGKPPMTRKYYPVKCWTLPDAQVQALVLFVPWYCQLRGIPVTACEDLRTFRLGGAGVNDPVTDVSGILAHGQISGPGDRVDGFQELVQMKRAGAAVQWRSGADFFVT